MTAALAAVNGANDVSKGVATLAGSGVTRYRTAIIWGALTTLAGAGANFGLPMSTTHVSTGAIAGIAGTSAGRLNRRTARDLVLAWTLTPLVAGLIAAASYLAAARLA